MVETSLETEDNLESSNDSRGLVAFQFYPSSESETKESRPRCESRTKRESLLSLGAGFPRTLAQAQQLDALLQATHTSRTAFPTEQDLSRPPQ